MTERPTVAGHCPMGCGRTLFLGDGGYITCSWSECPRPGAAAEILSRRETEHVVIIDSDGFTVLHPLRERLDSALLSCGLSAWMSALSGPPRIRGTYRVCDHDGEWTFELIEAVDLCEVQGHDWIDMREVGSATIPRICARCPARSETVISRGD